MWMSLSLLPVTETSAHRQDSDTTGEKVIIMATKNGISHDLENAATEVPVH